MVDRSSRAEEVGAVHWRGGVCWISVGATLDERYLETRFREHGGHDATGGSGAHDDSAGPSSQSWIWHRTSVAHLRWRRVSSLGHENFDAANLAHETPPPYHQPGDNHGFGERRGER